MDGGCHPMGVQWMAGYVGGLLETWTGCFSAERCRQGTNPKGKIEWNLAHPNCKGQKQNVESMQLQHFALPNFREDVASNHTKMCKFCEGVASNQTKKYGKNPFEQGLIPKNTGIF